MDEFEKRLEQVRADIDAFSLPEGDFGMFLAGIGLDDHIRKNLVNDMVSMQVSVCIKTAESLWSIGVNFNKHEHVYRSGNGLISGIPFSRMKTAVCRAIIRRARMIASGCQFKVTSSDLNTLIIYPPIVDFLSDLRLEGWETYQ